MLSADVSQAGSLVDFDRLRFDFNSPVAPTEAQLTRVEELINGWIGEAVAVQTSTMGLTEAKAAGAVAMFGEKYSDVVRVVDVPGVSMELCGGTHVNNTAEIGSFKVCQVWPSHQRRQLIRISSSTDRLRVWHRSWRAPY